MKIIKTTILTLIVLISSFCLSAKESVRPWMGVNIEEAKDGVLIKSAIPNTPAFRAGFKSGDIIQSVDGDKVKTPKALINLIVAKGVGNDVKVKYLSKGEQKTATLKLEAMPGILELAEKSLLNKKAPDFEGTDISKKKDQPFKLSNTKGKVRVIDFWATWCTACLAAHPYLSKFAKDNKDVIVIAVSDEDKKLVKKFAKAAKMRKVFNDSMVLVHTKENETHRKYYVPAYPMYVLIDKENVVKHLTVGAGRNLDELLKKAKALAK